MEIFELISENEKYFNGIPIILPKKKKTYVYKNITFIFYIPSDNKIEQYIQRSELHYSDFIVYGKVIIDDVEMLLLYVNFEYYGISIDGKTKYLGKSIKDLKIRGTKRWKDFTH
ncbi:hypothetical protein FPV195 [Fowlpox virus]|uniref:Protein FPV195 n=2 Tax=Fowlpox virus TaxID=10261 RepID=V195_FOWPN|nr:hypothetical protein FPV195 [Fowlpox virus]Q9J538.1 RecName: Full=Protein FPV195 [Fowlpox virus strain NVSL]UNS14425.1 ALPV-261 [Albatrosspox virus]WPD90907.1 A31-like hypothetical protein [Avipoxvirus sp.]CAE52733.1 A31R orthologue [Fowlpox virus isolate HP-438/Munich]AAF44539.1 ORF FPV195 [Fowlpox virus]ART91628.1 A31R ortholog [Fowlpox virus]